MLFDSLAESDGVRQAMLLNEDAGRLLSGYHQQLLRGDSPLSVAERELIATYVSGLNGCRYCYETHRATAINFGESGEDMAALVADRDVTAAPEKLRPLLLYARKLTLDHTNIGPDDVAAVRAAGWSERALHDLILVTAMFNFMNRFVHGHGITGNSAQWAMSGRYLYERGYAELTAPVPAMAGG